jgi:2-oxoglutarate ferredoxin oxidoreductase subunit alpha
MSDCEIGLVSFGCTSRAVYEAVELAEAKGVSVGFVRLRTVWPFPEKAVRALVQKAKTILVPEMNLQQIFFEVQRVAGNCADVVAVNKIGGEDLLTPEELCSEILGSV